MITKFWVTVTILPFFTTRGLAWVWKIPVALTADCKAREKGYGKKERRRETLENVNEKSIYGVGICIRAHLHGCNGAYHGREEGDAGHEDGGGSQLHGCWKRGWVLWV